MKKKQVRFWIGFLGRSEVFKKSSEGNDVRWNCTDILSERRKKGCRTLGNDPFKVCCQEKLISRIKCTRQHEHWLLFVIEVAAHPCLHIGHLTKIVTNNGWCATGNRSRRLRKRPPRFYIKLFLRELPSITAATMGSDRTEMTLPDENVACTVGN